MSSSALQLQIEEVEETNRTRTNGAPVVVDAAGDPRADQLSHDITVGDEAVDLLA